MKEFFKYFTVCFLSISSLSFCQIYKNKNILSRELPANIEWRQILSNTNSYFIAGFESNKAHFYNLAKDKSVVFSNVSKKKIAFMSGTEVYFGDLASPNPTDLNKNEVLVFELNGKHKKTLKIPHRGYVINYFTMEKSERIFYVTINFDEYLEGKTNGIMHGGIHTNISVQSIINFEYNQSPPPNRIALPVVAVKGNIYLAVENKYKIDIYSESGKHLQSISLPNFKPEPYSDKEIELLSPYARSVIHDGNAFPPILKKIEIADDGKIFVTRFPRPGALNLLVDVFNSSGKFLDTFELKLEKDENLIDSSLISNEKYCCLVLSKKSGRYSVKVYELKIITTNR